MAGGRQAFGIGALDALVGGGLLPGTLTVLAGSTGVGKTQLGLRWADQGAAAEGRRGVVCDLTSRGDAQNHADYARRQFGWDLLPFDAAATPDLDAFWDDSKPAADYLHPFTKAGRRVTRRDLEPDEWHAWKTDLARVLRVSGAFFYRNFVLGSRRVVIDGVEPSERPSESIQFEFFEYLYHQVLRKEDSWAARELFRERFRANESRVAANPYDHSQIGCLYLYTTPDVMLDDMLARPIGEGDVFANANTVILMGRTREAGKLGRALHVAKHRGSACSDAIHPYRITDHGLQLL